MQGSWTPLADEKSVAVEVSLAEARGLWRQSQLQPHGSGPTSNCRAGKAMTESMRILPKGEKFAALDSSNREAGINLSDCIGFVAKLTREPCHWHKSSQVHQTFLLRGAMV